MKLFFQDYGGAGNEPLVICHGFLGSSRMWKTAGKQLADFFHVFALDMRNHGESPHVAPHTYQAMADDLLAWMIDQKLDQINIMGHSMGGKVAMLLACHCPEKIKRLFVVDIAPKDYELRTSELLALLDLNLSEIKSRKDAEDKLAQTIKDAPFRAFLLTNLARDKKGQFYWRPNLELLLSARDRQVLTSLQETDCYQGPTQFIVGANSSFVKKADHKIIHHYFPHAQIDVIANAGHNPHTENTDSFVKAVRQFFTQ